MIKDTKLHYFLNKKTSDLYTVDSAPYSIAEAQTKLDEYLDQGYTLYDIGANHSLDVSGASGTNIIAVWKTAAQHRGEYRVKPSYFTGKNVVIMGVKVDNSNQVTATGLRVHFTQVEDIAIDEDVLFEDLDAHYHKIHGEFDWTFKGFVKCTATFYTHGEINVEDLVNTTIELYGELVINSDNGLCSCHVQNAELGQTGSMKELWTGQSTNAKILAVGDYIFMAGTADNYIYYWDRFTGEYLGSINNSDTTDYFETDGRRIFMANHSSPVYNIVTLEPAGPGSSSSQFLSSGYTPGEMYCNWDYLYIGNYSSSGMCVITLSTMLSSLKSTHSIVTREINGNGTNIFISHPTAGVIEVYTEAASPVYDRDISYSSGMGNSGLWCNTEYLMRSAASNYSSHICVIDLSDDSEELIDTYGTGAGLYQNMQVIGLDAKYFLAMGGGGTAYEGDIYRGLIGTIAPSFVCNTNWDGFHDINKFKDQTLFAVYRGTVYSPETMNLSKPIATINFTENGSPDPLVILNETYTLLTLSAMRSRFYTPPESAVENTRMFYIMEFDGKTLVPDNLKRFSASRRWVLKRVDVEAFLANSGTEKKIIDLALYDSDGSTPYDFDELPCDENYFLLAQAPDGSYKWFMWYNEAVHQTMYSDYNAGIAYTIKAVVQILKRNTTEDDLVNLKNLTNSPISGSLEMNNSDNEVVYL